MAVVTNRQIIFLAACDLVEDGKIQTTGRMIDFEMDDGMVITVPEPEPIHTFQHWKALGYRVNKGEHAITKLSIWKYVDKKKKGDEAEKAEDEENAVKAGHCIRKESHFFALHQVSPA